MGFAIIRPQLRPTGESAIRALPAKLAPAYWLLTAALAAPACAAVPEGVSWGGSLAVTSDYIYRGVSQSDGRAALQGDMHGASEGGAFAGVWASSRNQNFEPQASADLEIYLGRRIDLTPTWQATLNARSHYFVGGHQDSSDDYQELEGAISWLDRATLSVAVIPNAVRYWYYTRLSRSPAWVTEASGQWLVAPGLFLTGGAGYYRSTATGPGYEAATGYAYGNAGVAYERRAWRVDVGYFLAANEAQALFPYPVANRRWAGTLSWHF